MASLTNLYSSAAESQPPIRIGLIEPERREQALALLLTGRPRPDPEAVEQFLRFVNEQGLSLDQLWSAQRDDRLLAAALVVPSRGRTGMVFVSPIASRSALAVSAALLRTATEAQDHAALRLVQALLEPHQRLEAQALSQAGYRELATLVYMHRSADLPAAPLQLEPGLTLLTWSEAQRPLFARAILASYANTLDCPGLLGLRDIDDIIEGHMATGEFTPELWFCLVRGDEPVGVMLLNRVSQRQALELVYLGLSAAWRGRGLGQRLLRHALGLAQDYQATSMLLAVDQKNKPALRLYRSLRFSASARKVAMIFALK